MLRSLRRTSLVAAAALPAWRASRRDAMQALREP
jgi:ABC-type lipoprotein release transport system permease subunit